MSEPTPIPTPSDEEWTGACDSCGRTVTEEDCYQVLDDTGAHLYCDDCSPEEP